jgi:serine/threonine-protein kinase
MIRMLCSGCARPIQVEGHVADGRISCPHCRQVNLAPQVRGAAGSFHEDVTMPPGAPTDATATLPPVAALTNTPPATVPPGADGAGALPGTDHSPDGYAILAELGRGGMGVVYKARQTRLRRTVALKMILGGGHASGADLERFRTEAEAIARLQHPHIVQIHEVGEHDGLPFFSLEFCPGGSLDKKLAGTPLPAREAAALVEQLARGMQAAHDKGVIHRDLKPANVLLAEDGTPKVTDFGLAKKLDERGQTQTGSVMGTPSYMAPEQAGGKSRELGPACDIYALGAILYECLTGRPPFRAATPLDTVLQVVSDEPVPPRQLQSKMPRDLETICLKCLRKEPARRYATAADLADDLHRFQAGEAIRARPVGQLERAIKWVRRRPAVAALTVGLAATVLLLVVGGSGAAVWYANDRAGRKIEQAQRHVEEQRHELQRAEDQKRRELLRQQEQKHQEERNRMAVQAAVAQAKELQAKALWRQARNLLKQQLELLGAEADVPLRHEVQAALGHVAVAETLDRIRSNKMLVIDGKVNYASAPPAFAAAFLDLGLDFKAGEESALVARLAASPLRQELLAALDDWLIEEPDAQLRSRLCQVTAKLTGQAWRAELAGILGDKTKLQAVLTQVPADEMTPALLAGLCRQLHGRGGNGMALLESAVLRHPTDFWLLLELQNAYFHRDKKFSAQSIGVLYACLAVRPESVIAWTELGLALKDKGDREGAIAAYREAVRLDPSLTVAHLCLGAALYEKGDVEGAIASLQEAIHLNPKMSATHIVLGLALEAKGDLEGAISAYREAIGLGAKDAKTYNNLGIALRAKGDVEGALAAYQEALRLAPKVAVLHHNVGRALQDMGDVEGAIVAFRNAIRLDPKYAVAHRNLGIVLAAKNDVDGAIAAYKDAIRLDAKDAVAHNGLGLALRATGDLDGAIAAYKDAIRLNPKGAAAHMNLAMVFQQQQRFLDSVLYYQEAFAKDATLADNLQAGHRLAAARAAILAVAGKGKDAADLTTDERAGLRQLALDWLRADLAAWTKTLARSARSAEPVRLALTSWQRDTDLAGVRDDDQLAKLPHAERQTWQQFWADVDALLQLAAKTQQYK